MAKTTIPTIQLYIRNTDFLNFSSFILIHFHGYSVYGEMTNVPLLLWWPRGLPSGLRVAETVQTIDLAPTLVELAGLAVPETFQGQSLVPLIQGASEGGSGSSGRRRPAFSEQVAIPSNRKEDPTLVDSRSIVDDGWRLVHNVLGPEGTPEYELYDHRNDPLNSTDVAPEHPEVVERLAAALDSWHQWAAANRLVDEDLEQDLSAAELERLRSLGYLQ